MSSVVPAPFVEIAHKIKELTNMKVKELNMVREQYNAGVCERAVGYEPSLMKQGKTKREKICNILDFYMTYESLPVYIRSSENTWLVDALETIGYDSASFTVPNSSPDLQQEFLLDELIKHTLEEYITGREPISYIQYQFYKLFKTMVDDFKSLYNEGRHLRWESGEPFGGGSRRFIQFKELPSFYGDLSVLNED